MNESSILKHILLRCSCGHSRLFRNNIGAFQDKDGRWIRYGVGGKGGGDLIGWRRLTITPGMIGQTIAQYAEIEVKTPRGRPTKDQERRLAMVKSAGGVSGIARSPDEAYAILEGVDKA